MRFDAGRIRAANRKKTLSKKALKPRPNAKQKKSIFHSDKLSAGMPGEDFSVDTQGALYAGIHVKTRVAGSFLPDIS